MKRWNSRRGYLASRYDDGRVLCGDCRHFERAEGKDTFRASNLRRCRRAGTKRWVGDDAERCGWFGFRERCRQGVEEESE